VLDLLDRAETGDFDVLLVAKLDRLSRDYASRRCWNGGWPSRRPHSLDGGRER
jgi:hypothetical protein